ncbi:hypothetical protein [Sphaerisporangium dianthi]|uniref:Uncharacterized protein n=1 Tax=Sphaerisporangium dianthi TaxID=1436120 RepID=A0ABV9CRA9_9ACTN
MLRKRWFVIAAGLLTAVLAAVVVHYGAGDLLGSPATVVAGPWEWLAPPH